MGSSRRSSFSCRALHECQPCKMCRGRVIGTQYDIALWMLSDLLTWIVNHSSGFSILTARSSGCWPSATAENGSLPMHAYGLQPAPLVCSPGHADACMCIAGQLRQLTTRVAHVLPVSDDGGSTAEIVRVLGGPAVGDIRSRCLRLADDTGDEVATRHPHPLII